MIAVDDAESRLIELLESSGFDIFRPDIRKAWSVFKKFAEEPVDCEHDSILFYIECYVECTLDFVRQFVIHDQDDEYSHMEQLHLTFRCKFTNNLIGIEKNLWSDHFDCLENYFLKIESCPDIQTIMTYEFCGCEIYQDMV